MIKQFQRERILNLGLTRQFAAVSLLVVGLITTAFTALLSYYVTDLMLWREGQVTRDFVQNVFKYDGSTGYFLGQQDVGLLTLFRGSISHLQGLQDLDRINIYNRDSTVLWSSNESVVGQRFTDNPELDAALRGELVIERGRSSASASATQKPEHQGFRAGSYFVETYIPIRQPGQDDVVGVVELYKAPVVLGRAIGEIQATIWLSGILSMLALYFCLYRIVRRADLRLQDQNQRLLKSEALAMVGELTGAIAHNIRNPLASIRSTVELAADQPSAIDAQWLSDMLGDADRIDGMLKELVTFSHIDELPVSLVYAEELIRDVVRGLQQEFQSTGVVLVGETAGGNTCIRADRALFAQVLRILIVNGIEASPPGGRVTVQVSVSGAAVMIKVADNGAGIPADRLHRLFELFYTTKASGMGIGLALARRAVERFGGNIQVKSVQGQGATFIIEMRGC